MSLTQSDIHFLQSDPGARLLGELSQEDLSDTRILPLLTRLRKTYSADETHAALYVARLRLKAVDKFGDTASRMFFTEESLQQASHPLVAQYRARTGSASSILDLCCGIGTDAIAFSRTCTQVLGLDIDPVRIAIAQHNAAMLNSSAQFVCADVREGLPDDYPIAFYDPARRDARGRRIHDIEHYLPPLSLVKRWSFSRIIVKLSPGVKLNQLQTYDGGIEFISIKGELKESLLWLGDTFRGNKATLLTDTTAYHWQHDMVVTVPIAAPRGWLVEPDPSVLRARLVQDVAASLDGTMLDETIAYFTTDMMPVSPWVRSWKIIDWMPFHLKRLRDHLRQNHVGKVTVKKRGFPMTPDELIYKLRLKPGNESRTLVLTRYRDQRIVMICRDYVP